MKRVKGFIKLRIALGTLHGALPDATLAELKAYDDECAICRVMFTYICCITFSSFYIYKLVSIYKMTGTYGES